MDICPKTGTTEGIHVDEFGNEYTLRDFEKIMELVGQTPLYDEKIATIEKFPVKRDRKIPLSPLWEPNKIPDQIIEIKGKYKNSES